MTDNSAADYPILPKFDMMVHYGPRN